MRAHTLKDFLLDLLLLVLVATSLALSWKIWYPPDQFSPEVTASPSVQPQPHASERQMPEIFRPEMILVRGEGVNVAPLHTGSLAYKQIWPQLREMLSGLKAASGAFQVDQVPDRLLQAEWVQLRLPTPLMLGQWADLWLWDMPTLRNGSMRIDRVTIYLGEPGAIYLSGPVGTTLYLADLSSEHRTELLTLIEKLDPTLFLVHRPLIETELGARVQSDVVVPMLDRMPLAQVRMAPPDEQDEEARYFPDLSVVRQIDLAHARSLTDGQRLLNFLATGVLEYRTEDPSSLGTGPDMQRAIGLAQEWVGSRGGWPQEIVLRRYMQQPGRARLEFDFRSGGPFPVESVGAALQVQVSTQRVLYFSRHPSFVEMRFSRDQLLIQSPEEAVRRAVDQTPLLLTEAIRSMHLAYMVRPNPQGDQSQWVMEPAWVIQAAEARIYVPAAGGQENAPVVVVR